MPIGYLITVAAVALAMLLALRPVDRPAPLRTVGWALGSIVNESPFVAFYWVLAATLLALAQGDLDTPVGWAALGIAGTAAASSWAARASIRGRCSWSWRDTAGSASAPTTGSGRGPSSPTTSSTRRRSSPGLAGTQPSTAPTRPWCSSPEAPRDVRPDAPPILIAHGEYDMLVPVEQARALAERLGDVSSSPVVYAELPRGPHNFDLFHSIRFEILIDGIEAFAAWVRSPPATSRR